MLRGIAGVILGYIAMFIIVFVCLTLGYVLMGKDRVFEPASYSTSATWMILMVVVSLVAAVIGGLVCAAISGSAKAPRVLAILVFVLGLLFAVAAMGDNRPVVDRTGEVTNFEAMQRAKEPLWFSFASPLMGAIGVLVGGSLKRRKV